MNDTHRISGRHILVTGAASGIGKASALELARRGARLSLADINLAGVQAAAAEARAIVGLAAVTLSIYERSGRWLLALRPLAGLDKESAGAVEVTCAAELTTSTDSVTTPGFIFVRAGGGVGGMPDEELADGCKTALASARALSTGD